MIYDVEHITKCMIEYDTGVPMSVIIAIFLIVCGLIALFYQNDTDGIKIIRNVSWCIGGGYLFFILCSTVLFRDKAEETHCFLTPFWSYSVLYNRRIAEIVLNVLMFIPIGVLVSINVKKKGLLMILGIGCGLSLTIELLQLITRRGVFNIDDVIHNTLGCAIGYVAYRLCNSFLKVFTK